MIGALSDTVNAALAGPLTALWAAAPPGDSDPASGKGPEWGKAAPIGLLIWLLLGLALFLLIKSLNRHLRRVPASFDDPAGRPGESPGDGDGGRVAESVAEGADTADGVGPPGDNPGGDGDVGDTRAAEADGGDGVVGESATRGAGGRP